MSKIPTGRSKMIVAMEALHERQREANKNDELFILNEQLKDDIARVNETQRKIRAVNKWPNVAEKLIDCAQVVLFREIAPEERKELTRRFKVIVAEHIRIMNTDPYVYTEWFTTARDDGWVIERHGQNDDRRRGNLGAGTYYYREEQAPVVIFETEDEAQVVADKLNGKG